MDNELTNAAEPKYDWEICRCVRCDAEVDEATSYKQVEYTRMYGKKIKCTNHYCKSCETTLKTVGQGERTDMQARATYVAPEAPYTKQD